MVEGVTILRGTLGLRWREDWPLQGEAPDLAVHDLPHAASGTEWWWFHAQLHDGQREFGLSFQFMRHQAPNVDGGVLRSHSLYWFRSDATTRTRGGETWLDDTSRELSRLLTLSDDFMDPRIREAWSEALARQLPGPDRLLPRPVRVGEHGLDLDFGGVGTLRKDADGTYVVEADGEHSGFSLRMSALKPAAQQSAGGAKLGGLYSFIVPRLEVEGTYRQGELTTTVSGEGWYEHALGDAWYRPTEAQDATDLGWTYCGLRLDNGWDIAAISMTRTDITTGHATAAGDGAVLCPPKGGRVEAAFELRGGRPWTSLATLNTYNTEYDLLIPEHDACLRVRAWFPEQEIRSLIFTTGILEAHVSVEGTMGGRPVNGHGIVEVFTSNRIGDFERYITRTRDITRQELDRLYPGEPRRAELLGVAGSEDCPERLDELVAADLHSSLVRPLRHAAAGLGKSWRAYVAAAAIELFGVSSEPYRPLLGATEILHTGNLIIDDVEDRSPVRRGRPAVHTVFGDAVAINAGTAAYFVFDRVLRDILPDDDRLRLRVYQVYLQVLRAGHAGQGIDIASHRAAMDTAVATGDPAPVLRRVRTAHRLKTGVPVRGLGQMGAVIARATEEQISALGDYCEAIGLAYQISDDVMDLRGVTAPTGSGERVMTKHTAEDLRAGKVTMPLAHAVGLLPGSRMREVWHAVRDGAADHATAVEIALMLEEHGAVQACMDEARQVVDRAWKPLQEVAPCTYHSIMFGALGAYAARRERE